jgi:RimJ/RimL family protein N-acetyltransferase
MHKLPLDLPDRIETDRLYMRPYRIGDGAWYYAMSQKNRQHLAQYESDNVVMSIKSEMEAEIVVRDLAAAWVARECFFVGVFLKETDEFVGQFYIGPHDWKIPEFRIGFFADVDHEGRGFVAEATRAAIRFIFEHLKAHRVSAECDDTNTRSHWVLERCGMVCEAQIRENKRHPDGTFTGTFFYGILKSEFDKIKS